LALCDGNNLTFTQDNIAAVRDADVTIFSVPIAYMQDVIEEVAPHLKDGSIASDVCSIKDFPTKALQKFCPQGVTVIPTHPMFGPYSQSIAGQVFVLTPEEEIKADPRYIFLKTYLKKK